MWGRVVYSATRLSLYIIYLLNVIVCYLYCLLSAVCGKMGVCFSEGLNTLGPMYSGQTKDKSVLINFLFSTD